MPLFEHNWRVAGASQTIALRDNIFLLDNIPHR
jgi:hypothetical protein